MEPHPLKTVLQLQLATDASATLHLPYVLSFITEDNLAPSSHLTKWITRINSLLHSKDAGARWSGLCLAYKTSMHSRNIMVEHAQSWLGVALPILSKNEPIPTKKAAIHLLRTIFTSGAGIPEFQRQLAIPNVHKFSTVIIGLAEKQDDEALRALILGTLAQLTSLYPTLHRPLYAALSALSLRFLDGSAPNPTSKILLDEASRLYAVLPFTGGKAGAASHWRKAVDDTLAFAWNAFASLRTTFPSDVHQTVHPSPSADEIMVTVPLNLDRLRCSVVVLCDLLSTPTQRSVQLPLGAFVKFITTLLSCTRDAKVLEFADPIIQSMEVSIVPDLWRLACELVLCLAQCAHRHLTPHLAHLMTVIVFHLEQKLIPAQDVYFLRAIGALLTYCQPLESPSLLPRLTKAVLPTLINILLVLPDDQKPENFDPAPRKNKKSKKRAKGYEGDEVFRLSRGVLCPTIADRAALLVALQVIHHQLRNPNLSPALQSMSTRIILSMLLTLPQISPASLSSDPSFHRKLSEEVRTITTELGVGTTSVMSKGLGLVINTVVRGDHGAETFRELEVLIHPRVPPLVRSLPHVESLSLFRAEESQEEVNVREGLDLSNMQQQSFADPQPLHDTQDVVMEDNSAPPDPISSSASLSSAFAPLLPPSTAVVPPEREVISQQILKPSIPAHTLQIHPDFTIPESSGEQQAASRPIATSTRQDEDEDEKGEMPTINMESDSEEE